MKNRLEACVLVICVAVFLGGCGESCFKSDEIVMRQISVGDPSAPEIAISKFPLVPPNKAAGCEAMSLVRVDLNINPYGYVQDVTFLDPWPIECATQYAQKMKFAKIMDAPPHALEHFRVEIQNKRESSRQCIRISQ